MSHARRVWTEAEFMALPESMDRIELIDGEVVVSPHPTLRHQAVVTHLSHDLWEWARANPPAVPGTAPLDVRVAPGVILQPDLCVFRRGVTSSEPPLVDVPDFVIEVLSSRPANDRVRKRAIYEAVGVIEYWMVDPAARAIEVVTAGTITVHHGTVRSVALPGFAVDVHVLVG